MNIEQYSVVIIEKLNKVFTESDITDGSRTPEVGDWACIVEIYKNPKLGYELECADENGATIWLSTFSPEDADLKVV